MWKSRILVAVAVGIAGVLIVSCDASCDCGENEVYSNCSNGGCGPRECSQLGYRIGCVKMDQKYCRGGCVCKDGYLKDDDGKCIPKTECPECGGDSNAVAGCGDNCGRRCSDYKQKHKHCTLLCYDDGCDCRYGFVYDEIIDKCVLPDDCTPTCGIDEVYDGCANGGCRRRKCSDPGKLCIDPIQCEGGCICREGHTRALNGTCIPEDQCPALQCNQPNEILDTCPQTCPPQTCESIGKIYDCPIQPAVCGEPACRCKEGYYRNAIGECISEADCKKCSGPNEYFSCGGACDNVCRSLNRQNQTNCPIINVKCNEMCYCVEGYARDDDGICIPIEECPAPCADDEVYEVCPINIGMPLTCSQLGYPIDCPPAENNSTCSCGGKPACICANRKVRNDEGKCVSRDMCPSCGGDPNAETGCGTNCGRLCSNYNKTGVACPLVCNENGCDCKKGFLYDSNLYKCVLPKDCTPTCEIDEVYDSCANGGCRRRKCSDPGILCIDPKQCEGGCICREGYTRDCNGTCIPEDKCPAPTCEIDEVYDGCANGGCRRRKCSDPGILCIDPIQCEGGCICREGYTRDCNGTCIPEDQCPAPTCGVDEVYDGCANGGCRRRKCSDPGILCIDPIQCEGGCICREGYTRDCNGTCIPEDQCPALQCNQPNEILDTCPQTCPPQTCESIGKIYDCPIQPAVCGEPACRCKEGYYRNSIGECISEADCKKCTGPNEYFSCGGACDNVCRTLNRQNQTNCPIINVKCNEMCYCEEGYARDDDGICIPIEKCPAPCADDEVYEVCPINIGMPLTCSQLGYPIDCPPAENNSTCNCGGKPACICANGKVRNDEGKCVSRDMCPSCGGDPNAETGCGTNCGRLCSNFNKTGVACPLVCNENGCDCKEGFLFDSNLYKCVLPKDCTPTCGIDEVYDGCANGGCRRRKCSDPGILCIDPIQCEGGCICREGYTRDCNGTCIPEDQCPAPTCGIDEVYDGCANGGCRRWKCSDPGILCIDPIQCEGGCICPEGYTRASNGTCIPEDQCPALQCNQPNEILDTCPQTCPPQTCESIGKIYDCPIEPAVCGEPACRCKEGYYRNSIGECISEADCKKCTGPNEYFSCGGACDNVCRTLNRQNQTNCPIINVKCNEMCYCEEGYARDDNRICIPIEKCPAPCADDEVYEVCPINIGMPLSCSQLGYPIDCPPAENNSTCSCGGKPACICANGKVRNDEGKCISRDMCPSCGGDPHAVPGCGSNCGRRCSNYKQKNVACPLSCVLNGCDCRHGYVYDDVVKRCVHPKDCCRK